jgi:ApbE superfamily uncharacterized protein (UPF0280 family)
MSETPHIALLPDGRRLHLQHGPIDLVIEAFAANAAIGAAYQAAARRFEGVLSELAGELDVLRAPASAEAARADGPIARNMLAAVAPFARGCFITPMAAVAGAVADDILAHMIAAAPLSRAYVNNGGDIALHLSPGTRLSLGLVDRPDRPSLFARAALCAESPVRGIATSGRHGRSFSLGIADAVTVLAATAAKADAAATIIANAVDLPGHPAITRIPANAIKADSDLGSIPVTRHLGPLRPSEVMVALQRGAGQARRLLTQKLIHAAALHLSGETLIVGDSDNVLLSMSKQNHDREERLDA